MDLSPTAEERALREEIRAWLRANLPWEYGKGLPPRFDDLADEVAFGREWQAKLASGRWVGVGWPEEYGGRGAGPVEHYIVTEELARGRAPELVGRIGVNLVGPTLLAHGTDAQKARWLPNILDASEIWCQLFSEPGAGSDLTSLQTRAEPVEGGYVLNGQKVWTSYAQFADWGWCLARTNTTRRSRRASRRWSSTCTRRASRCGRCGRSRTRPSSTRCSSPTCSSPTTASSARATKGWRIANSTLTHERGVNPRQLVVHSQLVDELWRLADERDAFADPRLAPKLAQAFVEVRLFQLHNWRSISRTAKGEDPGRGRARSTSSGGAR